MIDIAHAKGTVRLLSRVAFFCLISWFGACPKWSSHAHEIPESSQTWMAWIGPDTPALGERSHANPVTESEVAATLAALLGEDYHFAVPASGKAIADVLGK
jgi:hypothetical protein